MPFELCEEFDKLNLMIIANIEAMELEVGSSLLQQIRGGQLEDEKVQEIKRNTKEENRQLSWRMIKVCHGTREGFVCITSKN
jgi:hypothetical protein